MDPRKAIPIASAAAVSPMAGDILGPKKTCQNNNEALSATPRLTNQKQAVAQVMAMQLLTERQVSAILATPMGTLRRWRCVGTGPRFVKMGLGPKARVKYDAVDIYQYVEAGRRDPSVRATQWGQHGY
jgi:hypothetical protein